MAPLRIRKKVRRVVNILAMEADLVMDTWMIFVHGPKDVKNKFYATNNKSFFFTNKVFKQLYLFVRICVHNDVHCRPTIIHCLRKFSDNLMLLPNYFSTLKLQNAFSPKSSGIIYILSLLNMIRYQESEQL